MVGDLGKSLWLRSIFGSVIRENRHCVMIGKATLFFHCWDLVKFVPSLAGNTPSLDSLLPMLSKLASSRTNLQTTPTTSHQAAADKLTFLTPSKFRTRLHITPTSLSASTAQPYTRLLEGPSNKAHKPKYTSVGDTTEPVSLEIFNKAATDLEAKWMINLRKYTKYLAKKTQNQCKFFKIKEFIYIPILLIIDY